MAALVRASVRGLAWASLAASGLALVVAPAWAPIAVAIALASTLDPLRQAWGAAKGTALGSAVVWAAAAVGFGLASQIQAGFEPLASGRPWSGHWTYLCTLATLATLISILNARRPGAGAWALLMILMVLVLLIPWLEGGGLLGEASAWDRLRLDAPWTIFYGLLVLAGVTNHLPTRFGLASLAVGLGLIAEYLALTRVAWTLPTRAALWSVMPWTLALAIWIAEARARGPTSGRSDLERLWFWFRDRWGVVWALRVQERFNRSADASRWPIRLSWHGVVPGPQPANAQQSTEIPIPEAAEATLKSLLRRFVEPARLP